ncbi:hypothetical protein GG344DRAFT_70436 [Lentinula edodes]|nr:hypothetical protein GG344DRAFT_70436 [Lentinula edodes]
MIKERNTGYIVVDAMDECKEAEKVSRWLSSHSSQLWMLVTSRLPAVGFENRIINIALGEKESRMNADIETYLKSRIDTDPRFKGETGDYVKETLKKGADGVFRWVECQLRAVQQYTSPTGVRKALSKLPKDLKETYANTLQKSKLPKDLKETYANTLQKSKLPNDLKETYANTLQKCQNVENADEAQKLLLWLLYAFEPLTKEKFREIVAVDLEEQVIYSAMEFQVERAVDSTFVTVGQDNIVQLAHASVKEYLIFYSLQKERQDLFQLNEKLAHDIMTQTTIIYLLQKENIDSGNYRSFAHYSVEKWLSHASKVEEDKLKGKAQNLIYRMLENNNQLPHPRGMEQLSNYYWKLVQMSMHIKLLLENGADVNAYGGYYRNALQAAAGSQNEAIVKFLLEKGAEVNAPEGRYRSTEAFLPGPSGLVQQQFVQGIGDLRVHSHSRSQLHPLPLLEYITSQESNGKPSTETLTVTPNSSFQWKTMKTANTKGKGTERE